MKCPCCNNEMMRGAQLHRCSSPLCGLTIARDKSGGTRAVNTRLPHVTSRRFLIGATVMEEFPRGHLLAGTKEALQ